MIPLGVLAARRPASGGASYRDEVLADSPRVYFPLDDATTPTDVMGVATVEAVAGVTLGVAGIGDGATAAAFDGGATNRGIRLAAGALVDDSGYTVSMLAKATNMTTARSLAASEGPGPFLLRHDNAGNLQAYGQPWATQVGTNVPIPSPTATHHYAFTMDATGVYRLYIDGTQVATRTGGSGVTARPVWIGSRASSNATFLGTIAGFATFDAPLSAARILAHAQAAGVA